MMKTIKQLMLAVLFIAAGATVNAQEANAKGIVTAQIQTTAECGSCKKKVEDAMYYTKGVKSANLDPTTMVLTVKFKESKTDLATIRKAVAKVGFTADDVAANPKEYAKLPACCKAGSCKKKEVAQ